MTPSISPRCKERFSSKALSEPKARALRRSAEEVGVRGAKTEFVERRGVDGLVLEAGSLARGVQGLAVVALPRSQDTALPQIRRWRSAAQGNLAAGGVAGSGEGAGQILLLRSPARLCPLIQSSTQPALSLLSIARLMNRIPRTPAMIPGSVGGRGFGWPFIQAINASANSR